MTAATAAATGSTRTAAAAVEQPQRGMQQGADQQHTTYFFCQAGRSATQWDAALKALAGNTLLEGPQDADHAVVMEAGVTEREGPAAGGAMGAASGPPLHRARAMVNFSARLQSLLASPDAAGG